MIFETRSVITLSHVQNEPKPAFRPIGGWGESSLNMSLPSRVRDMPSPLRHVHTGLLLMRETWQLNILSAYRRHEPNSVHSRIQEGLPRWAVARKSHGEVGTVPCRR